MIPRSVVYALRPKAFLGSQIIFFQLLDGQQEKTGGGIRLHQKFSNPPFGQWNAEWSFWGTFLHNYLMESAAPFAFDSC
jgi:hypothetical protein